MQNKYTRWRKNENIFKNIYARLEKNLESKNAI